MSIKIYTKDSKYYMEDLSTNTTVELTEITKDGISLILPENSANRNFCSLKKAEKGITLEYKETKTFGPKDTNAPKSPKVNLEEYYTDEERTEIEKLKTKIDKINERVMERAKADIKKAELRDTLRALDPEVLRDTLKGLDPEILKTLMTEVMA